jgi:hypothetical protein
MATGKRRVTRRLVITHAVVRRLALGLPGAVESSHFKRPDFRVRNKIFATLPPDRRTVVLKSGRANLDALISSDGATFWDEWRGSWLGVRLDRISLPVLRELVGDAWRVVAPKKLANMLE